MLKFCGMLTGAVLTCACGAGDVVLDGGTFRLTVGDDATAKTLVLKANGEECLDAREGIPLFAVTQERPFNNEIKLAHPNKRTTYRANRLRRAGNQLIVGFETAPYEAKVSVKEGNGYVYFTLGDFICEKDIAYHYLSLDVPPVAEFRVLQLPVKNRENVADWLNGVWDGKAATAVVAGDPYADADHESRFGFQLLHVDLRAGMKLRGGSAAVVCGVGREGFLDAMDRFEADFGLPRGVKSRRDPRLNRSIATTAWATPQNFDVILDMAKRGGFSMMQLYFSCFTKDALARGYWVLHDYVWDAAWKNKEKDLDDILAKIKGAGMTPGFHVLQTHVGFGSSYVTPVADPRLNLKRHFTLACEIPASGDVTEIRVFENPVDSPRYKGTRILKFGGELFSYADYTTEPPYRFTGVKRGDQKTRAAAHPYGEIGGVLDVSEYSAESCYADQRTDLPDEIAAKIAKIYNRGFEFIYLDGSEGVNPPCNVNVSLAQWRVVRQLRKMPLFTEGAAKTHFGWHLQARGNAFDVFPPEIFKKMIVRFPQTEAPQMAKEMTRLDFGWWDVVLPGTEVTLKDALPFRKVKSIGTQPDMWEFGTSRAAAWDCPTAIMIHPDILGRHPRRDDLLEVMRRWEDVRAKNWLTPTMKEALKSPTQEHHLYVNEKGEYELCEIEMLPTPEKAPFLRGFIFERQGRRVLAHWHTRGSGRVVLPLGAKGGDVTLSVEGVRYRTTDLSKEEVREAFANARVLLTTGTNCVVDVTACGACGDGMADDAPAIQRALDRRERPLVVRIPKGSYRLGRTLVVSGGTRIEADPAARLFVCEKTPHREGDYLLTNAGATNGTCDADIAIVGGVWDGNSRRGTNVKPDDIFAKDGWSGVLLNFRRVKGLVLRDLECANSVTYNVRLCEADGFDFSGIRFSARERGWNQDGIHMNGFCRNGRIADVRAVTKGQTADDLLAFNADDSMTRIENRGMVAGPIENVVCRDIFAEDCHSAVRFLSVDSAIRNVRIENITAGCRCYAVNADAARYCRTPLFSERDRPDGVGHIENVSLSNFTFWATSAAPEPLVALETNVRDLTLAGLRRDTTRDVRPGRPFLRLRNCDATALVADGVTREVPRRSEAVLAQTPQTLKIYRQQEK